MITEIPKKRRFWPSHAPSGLTTEPTWISAQTIYWLKVESTRYIFLLLIVWVCLISNFHGELWKTHHLCSRMRYSR